MAIKKILLAAILTLSLGWGVSLLLSQTVFASPSDGKTCLLAPLGGLEDCPYGYGITDLSTAGYVLVPNGSQCFKGDDALGEDSPSKFSCNYDSDSEKDGVQVFAAWSAIRDKAIAGWKAANPGQGNPTEGQIYTFINTNVYAEINPQDEVIVDQDCSNLSGVNKIRCEAIQSCVENDPEGNITKCTEAYSTCVGDDTSEEKANECAAELSAADNESLCKVEGGLGWILCPVMNTVANINDFLYTNIIESFLVIPSLDTSTEGGNALYQAWSLMRNIANVMFVIAFLMIIYSQLTSAGVNNYGIKKMLPRLIVGAILVNTSYWLTVLGAEVSNVVGSSVYNVINSVAPDLSDGDGPGTWSTITGNILAGTVLVGAAIWAGLSMLLPLAVSSVFFLLGLAITLAFRHAALLILVVLAPIAAVAYMLPNTDKFSKSWWGLYKLLLYLYPIIAFVVAVGDIAGTVIFATAADMEMGIPKIMLMLTAVAAPAFAIIAIPSLVKATAGMLGKFGLTNPFGGMMNAAKNRSKDVGGRADRRIAAYGTRSNPSDGRWKRTSRFGARWVPGASRRSRRDVYDKMKDQQFDADIEAGARGSTSGTKLSTAVGAAQTRLDTVKVNAEIEELRANKELHVNAAVDNLRLDAVKSDLKSEVSEEKAKEGSEANKAAQEVFIQNLRGESAERMLRSDQVAALNQKNATGEYTDTAKRLQERAAGIDVHSGAERVVAGAIAAQDKETAEAINNRIALAQDKYSANELVSKSKADYVEAVKSGDSIGARAATQILARQTGSAGVSALEEAVLESDAYRKRASGEEQKQMEKVLEGVKYDITGSGLKGKSRALDIYATDKGKRLADGTTAPPRTFAEIRDDPATIASLNQVELAGQTASTLEYWAVQKKMKPAQAAQVKAAHEKGTLPLDDKKLDIFTQVAETGKYTPTKKSSKPSKQPNEAAEEISSSPQNPRAGYTDEQGRWTPGTASTDYHDGMQR